MKVLHKPKRTMELLSHVYSWTLQESENDIFIGMQQ